MSITLGDSRSFVTNYITGGPLLADGPTDTSLFSVLPIGHRTEVGCPAKNVCTFSIPVRKDMNRQTVGLHFLAQTTFTHHLDPDLDPNHRPVVR